MLLYLGSCKVKRGQLDILGENRIKYLGIYSLSPLK